MRNIIISLIHNTTKLDTEVIDRTIEIPPEEKMGDFAFPCFILAKQMKKAPQQIAADLAKEIRAQDGIARIAAEGPYLNFYLDKTATGQQMLNTITSDQFLLASKNGKKAVIEFSSPNIAKHFGIGHLRSTIIGNAIANIYERIGYEVTRINYLGDWGTQFGKLLLGYELYGDPAALQKDPIQHLLDIYVRINQEMNEDLETQAREKFRLLEQGDAHCTQLWQQFRQYSVQEFDRIYQLLGVSFDVISGESRYTEKAQKVIKDLTDRNLAQRSDGALIVDLEDKDLGVAIIQKSDGTSIYTSRDIAAAIERHEEYAFDTMIYEVGGEQKRHFQQVFVILELLGHPWATSCIHVDHGLYLGTDGKKMSTRKGKTMYMKDIWEETVQITREAIKDRHELEEDELQSRAQKIARAAIIYGDLKNYRSNDTIFDISKLTQLEGDTGPYLLYTYARASSILRKASAQEQTPVDDIDAHEFRLIKLLSSYPDRITVAYTKNDPSQIAAFCLELAQEFNVFYQNCPVLDNPRSSLRIRILHAYRTILRDALSLLGIETIEEM